jgi:hypothetical protein
MFSEKNNLYFLRFGDGDLNLIRGHKFEQRHKNSRELMTELTEAFCINDERYIISTTAGSLNDGSGSYHWLKGKDKKKLDLELRRISERIRPGETFDHALVFQFAFENNPKWLIKFIKDVLHDKKVLLVAGDPLCKSELVKKVFNVSRIVEFPGLSDAYYHLNRKMYEITEKIKGMDVVLPTIGMASRVLAKRLWECKYEISLIDFGVIVDALANAQHRGWTKRVIDKGAVNVYKKEFKNCLPPIMEMNRILAHTKKFRRHDCYILNKKRGL